MRLVLVCAIPALIFLAEVTSHKSAGVNAEDAPSCRTDFRQCADNADLVNHHERTMKAQVACQMAGDGAARYGKPEWPRFSFSRFRVGRDAVESGVLTLIEPESRYSNMYGAMQRASVYCDYDFTAAKVKGINIVPQ